MRNSIASELTVPDTPEHTVNCLSSTLGRIE